MNNLKIRNVVFCESIRPELGGKYTLLGASAPELTIPASSIPAVILGSVFVTGMPQEIGPFAVEIRVTNPDKDKIIGGVMQGDFKEISLTSLAIGQMPLQITKEGNYTFEWNFGGKKWTVLEKIIIRTAPELPTLNPTPIA